MDYLVNNEFWEYADKLVESSEIVIDRPRGTRHPRYQDLVYPVDYGYLKNTRSTDNSDIDIYVGEMSEKRTVGILCIIDIMKRDSEIKILYSCSEKEIDIIYKLNNEKMMRGILINRR